MRVVFALSLLPPTLSQAYFIKSKTLTSSYISLGAHISTSRVDLSSELWLCVFTCLLASPVRSLTGIANLTDPNLSF